MTKHRCKCSHFHIYMNIHSLINMYIIHTKIHINPLHIQAKLTNTGIKHAHNIYYQHIIYNCYILQCINC